MENLIVTQMLYMLYKFTDYIMVIKAMTTSICTRIFSQNSFVFFLFKCAIDKKKVKVMAHEYVLVFAIVNLI